MNKAATLGQVFTPPHIVKQMIFLRRNQKGKVLDPCAGTGAFYNKLYKCVGIESDPEICPKECRCLDFFDYPTYNKFGTIIGNPSHITYKHTAEATRKKLKKELGQTDLYVFFIDKCLDHLEENGELIFITPRGFTAHAHQLNEKLYSLGTITDLFDLGSKGIIWRFAKNDFSRRTNTIDGKATFTIVNSQLLFLNGSYRVQFSKLFSVKIGAISGLDRAFISKNGNHDFVWSKTRTTGLTRKMWYGLESPNDHLEKFKDQLMSRQIRKFTEEDWWHWGRNHFVSDQPRVYVNCKTREPKPFFTHECKNYDGSVFAILLKNNKNSPQKVVEMLNDVRWEDLGFVCDGQYVFNQRALDGTLLPSQFESLL